MIEFKPWGKTPRFFRDVVVTEKIDGTNAAVIVAEVASYVEAVAPTAVANVAVEGRRFLVGAQSRNRLITPADDNAGFARWVGDNAEALAALLGPGHHFGEWWGKGINRGYGMTEKRFSLFNVHRHADAAASSGGLFEVVPTLYSGPLSTLVVNRALDDLEREGSRAVPGFMKPEGIVVYHSASRQVYKALIENDHLPKGIAA